MSEPGLVRLSVAAAILGLLCALSLTVLAWLAYGRGCPADRRTGASSAIYSAAVGERSHYTEGCAR